MLTANLLNETIEAAFADRGLKYHCPECGEDVVLHRGRYRLPHFAHRPGSECLCGRYETLEHLQAKATFAESFRRDGQAVQLEQRIQGLAGDRRADLILNNRQHGQVVIELQHTPLPLDQLENRFSTYAELGYSQIWIPILPRKVLERAEPTSDHVANSLLIDRYRVPPYIDWIHGLNYRKGFWTYDPQRAACRFAQLISIEAIDPERSYYDEYGEEVVHGGGTKILKSKKFVLGPPLPIDQLGLRVNERKPFSRGRFYWPAGRVATFVVK